VLNNSASDLFRQMANGSSGGVAMRGGSSYNFTINNTVGDIATKRALDEYQNTLIDGIRMALEQNAGKGTTVY